MNDDVLKDIWKRWKSSAKVIMIGTFLGATAYAIARMLSPVCLSVCPSVTRVDHTKTVEVWIMKFSPYGSAIPLIFREQVSSRNSEGFPQSGGVKGGWG